MAKKQKKAATPPPAPAPEPIVAEWMKPAPAIEPLPVQFTARQLAYLHSALLMDVNLHRLREDMRRDETSRKVIMGALDAVHASMRDWWDRHEESTAAAGGTWSLKTSFTVPPAKP